MSVEYKSSLNNYGIKCFNSAGMGVKLSPFVHISSAVVLPPNARIVVTSGQTGMREDLSYLSSFIEKFNLAFANVEASFAAADCEGWIPRRVPYDLVSSWVEKAEVDEAIEFVTKKYLAIISQLGLELEWLSFTEMRRLGLQHMLHWLKLRECFEVIL